jgi:glycosyltransferase involved in cell wall biosynthesis
VNVSLLTSARSWRGSGVSFVNTAQGLTARGHTVALLATAPAVTAGFAAAGLPVRELPIHDTGLAEARILTKALTALETDVLIADKPRDVRLGALASLARRFALVYKYLLNRTDPVRDLGMRLAYRRVGLTIFLTRTGERDVLARARFMGKPPHRVIYEGVDAKLFRPDDPAGQAFRERHGLGGGPVLLAAGALEWEKRYDWLLQALAHLSPGAPALVIRGSGSLEAQIRAQAERMGLNVRFLGFLPPDELAAAYNAASCFVHAGHVETFGLTVAEAMACGRPVVAVASGGVPEVLGDTGVLVPDGDPAGFAAALASLLADPGRRAVLSGAARRRAVELFSLERMGREYCEALEAARAEGARH